MTKEEINCMALDTGFDADDETTLTSLMRFAALVAAAERNKIAAWMMERGYATGHGDTTEDLLKELDWQAAEREREACARECWEFYSIEGIAQKCNAAIRARGD